MTHIIKQKPFVGSKINIMHPLAKGLMAAWAFDEMDGSRIYDRVTGEEYIKLNTSTWKQDSLNFSSSIANISTWDLHRLNPPGDMSISLWFLCRTWAVGANYRFLWRKWADSNKWNYEIAYNGTQIQYIVYYTALGTYRYAYFSAPLTLNAWHHLVGVREGDTLRIYINNVKGTDGTGSGSPDSVWHPTTDIGNVTGYTYYHDGQIKDPIIWDRALNESEISLLYEDPYCLWRNRRKRIRKHYRRKYCTDTISLYINELAKRVLSSSDDILLYITESSTLAAVVYGNETFLIDLTESATKTVATDKTSSESIIVDLEERAVTEKMYMLPNYLEESMLGLVSTADKFRVIGKRIGQKGKITFVVMKI